MTSKQDIRQRIIEAAKIDRESGDKLSQRRSTGVWTFKKVGLNISGTFKNKVAGRIKRFVDACARAGIQVEVVGNKVGRSTFAIHFNVVAVTGEDEGAADTEPAEDSQPAEERPMDSSKVGIDKGSCGPAHMHRAIDVARALWEAGIWDGQTEIAINYSYDVHQRVFGVQHQPVEELEPGIDYVIRGQEPPLVDPVDATGKPFVERGYYYHAGDKRTYEVVVIEPRELSCASGDDCCRIYQTEWPHLYPLEDTGMDYGPAPAEKDAPVVIEDAATEDEVVYGQTASRDANDLIPADMVLPALYEQEDKGDDAIAWVKIFNPAGSESWYISEYNPDNRLAFGWVDGVPFPELGYIDINELESVTVGWGLGLHLERDLWFEPVTLGELKAKQVEEMEAEIGSRKAAVEDHRQQPESEPVVVEETPWVALLPETCASEQVGAEDTAPTSTSRQDAPALLEIPFEQIAPGENDRQTFDAEGLYGLATSIQSNGLVESLAPLVRPVPYSPEYAERHQQLHGASNLPSAGQLHEDGVQLYEIVAGERRVRAMGLNLAWETIPCQVRHLSDEEAASIMLAENMARKDLSPVEEAKAYQRRIDQHDWSVSEVADKAGVSVQRVRDRLKLLNLVHEAQHFVSTGAFPIGHALMMDGLDANRQRAALKVYNSSKRMTYFDFQELVAQLREQQAQDTQEGLWNLDDLVEEAEKMAEVPLSGKEARTGAPVNRDLPQVRVNPRDNVGKLMDRWIADLLAAGKATEAAAVGNLYNAMVAHNWAQVPASPALPAEDSEPIGEGLSLVIA